MDLYIGNKNYSSWSMRPWVLMRALDIPFDEVMVKFDGFSADSQFKTTMTALSPSGTVPVLVDGEICITDTLAILEYLYEQQADIWPDDKAARAAARNLTSLMHSGFAALRSHCPMIIDADLKHVGAALYRLHEDLRHDLALLEQVLAPYLTEPAGPLFGKFCAADAFFAPVMMRLTGFGLPLSPALEAYRAYITSYPAVEAWVADALAEQEFLDFEEPYRSGPDADPDFGNLMFDAHIRSYHPDDKKAVIALWEACGLTRPWNDPELDIAAKLTVQSELFFVMYKADKLVGSVMASFDGHRGMVYYLAVASDYQKAGLGKMLMDHVETALAKKGCSKINLMIREDNHLVQNFYDRIGYKRQDVTVYGKWLTDGPVG